jgi:hypothetical protein
MKQYAGFDLMDTYTYAWYNAEQTIARLDFPDHWTWDSFSSARHKLDEMINAAPHSNPIGVFVFIPSNTQLPPLALSGGRKLLSHRNSRVTTLILVTDNTFLKTMWRTLGGLLAGTRQAYQLATTLPEAEVLMAATLAKAASAALDPIP